MAETGPPQQGGVSQGGLEGSVPSSNRPWDARLSARLVAPLKNTRVSPNCLTTLRLIVGLAAAAALAKGTYPGSNAGALLMVVSNFLDHADGELARLSGKSSRFGHLYDLLSDALVTIILFVAMGTGMRARPGMPFDIPPIALGGLAGGAVALIFYLRMRIETLAGKAATRQASFAGFETEDILYLMPLVTLCDAVPPLLIASAVCAPLYAFWVVVDYRRVLRRTRLLPGRRLPEWAK